MKRTVFSYFLLTAVITIALLGLKSSVSAGLVADPFNSELDGIICPAAPMSFMIAMGDNATKKKNIHELKRRFIDNRDGTVTDTESGLVWLKDANRFGKQTWDDAVTLCKKLSDDGKLLTDGSKPGEWRLPDINEMKRLIHKDYYNPAISNDTGTGKWTQGPDSSFINVQTDYYWVHNSGTSPGGYIYVGLRYGDVRFGYKTYSFYVWPVKGNIKRE